MSELLLFGDAFRSASQSLESAGVAFIDAGRVQVGAEYGSAAVGSAVASFAGAMEKACGASNECSRIGGESAMQTVASFEALDAKVAASVVA